MDNNTFNLEFNGLTFVKYNFPQQRQEGYIISMMDGLYLPPIRSTVEDRTATMGGNVYRQEYGPRIINVEGVLSSRTSDIYFEKVRALSIATQLRRADFPIRITRWDGISKIVYGRILEPPSPVEVGGSATRAIFRFSLYCSVPLFFDEHEQTDRADVAVGGGGFVPMFIPGVIGQREISMYGGANITNSGTEAYWSRMIIHGPITNPEISNLTTGESFWLQGTIPAGQYVDIWVDADGLHIFLNGQTNWRSFLRGTFFKIVQGTNIVHMDGDSSGGEYVEISFKNPYLTLAG